MALKTFQELKSLNEKELLAELKKISRMRRVARLENKQGLLKDFSVIGKYKKYKAQINTLQEQRSHS